MPVPLVLRRHIRARSHRVPARSSSTVNPQAALETPSTAVDRRHLVRVTSSWVTERAQTEACGRIDVDA
jgi:hypothetical protein